MPATTFSDMPTLGASRSTPSPPFHRRRKSWARKIERCCCTTFAYFPLVFVYGLTTWAIYVQVDVSLMDRHDWPAFLQAGIAIAIYSLANISYTTAVFTSPGSPLDARRDNAKVGRRKHGGYEGLPMHEDEDTEASDTAVPAEWMSSVTAKSTGKPRYCKKCRSVKPDRTHHCSTCGRCVLKMDHHCPWLATCVGLRNYKAFLLFLVYISLLCWVCFASTAMWVWVELLDSHTMDQGARVVNIIVLAVLSGIIGLVLSGFAGWHIYLTLTGQTTIESLEKTRYLTTVRKSLETGAHAGRNHLGEGQDLESDGVDDQPLADRLKMIHANALPGVLRPEEGEISLQAHTGQAVNLNAGSYQSPATSSLSRSFASLEAQRERDRYNAYLDELDSEKMPNAFDNGWRRNLLHVIGDQPLLWFLPICNTSGDGWLWDVSAKWTEARDRIGRERDERNRANAAWDRQPTQNSDARRPTNWRWNAGAGFVDRNAPPRATNFAAQGPPMAHQTATTSGLPLQSLDRNRSSPLQGDNSMPAPASTDEMGRSTVSSSQTEATADWNDIPEEFLSTKRTGADRGSARRKGE